MPSEPAMAVSTAINTLSKETHPFPPSMEGDAESVAIFLFIDINFTVIGFWVKGLWVYMGLHRGYSCHGYFFISRRISFCQLNLNENLNVFFASHFALNKLIVEFRLRSLQVLKQLELARWHESCCRLCRVLASRRRHKRSVCQNMFKLLFPAASELRFSLNSC